MITLEDIIIGIVVSVIIVKSFDALLWLLDKWGEWDRAHNPKGDQ